VSLWRLTATSGMLTMILNLVLTPRGWLQECLDFQPRLRTDNARPIFLRFSTFIIHTFIRRCIDSCIKILTGNTVSREFHESHHRRVNGLLTVFAKQFCPHTVNKRVNKTCLGIWEINNKYVERFAGNVIWMIKNNNVINRRAQEGYEKSSRIRVESWITSPSCVSIT